MELGSKADFSRDHIKVDAACSTLQHNVYLALNKPKGA